MESVLMIIEVIADTVRDAKLAEQAGANRIELISGVTEGGLTPSYGLIKSVCETVKIPVNVMIRPHSRSFCYTKEELEIMATDIKACKELNASGVVFGTNTQYGTVDEAALTYLIQAAEGLDITFHRAFDEVSDQLKALEIIQSYPAISRVLTSGGKMKASEAVEQFNRLISRSSKTSLSIMAGAGLTEENISTFIKKTQIEEIHIGSGARNHNSLTESINPDKVKKIVHICRSIK